MRLAAIGLIGGSIPFLLFFQGLAILAGAQAGGALASFLHKGMFIFVAVLAFVFLKDRMGRYLLVAAVLLMVGTFAVLLPTLEGPALAYGLILLATAFWAVEITLSKATLKRLGANLVIVGRMGFGAFFIGVFLGATGQLGAVVSLDAAQWQWVVVTVAFLAAYVGTFYHGLARIDATSATAILVLGSAVTAGVTALAQGIPPSPATSLGIALILLGVAAGVVRALRHREVEVVEPVPIAT
jgi:drug/metabolite transporter (DMT)-like permease